MRYGRVIIGALIAAALSCFPFPLKGQDVIEPDAEDLLKESLENDDLTAALQYVNILNQRDTMSILALLNCADYYIDVQKYQECIDFCNKWSTKMGNSYDGLFDREYGQSYYFLSDYKCAAKYLKCYILWCDENDLNVGSFDYGLYSECLYETQQYKPACKYFEKYFSIASEEENTTIDRLYLSKWKESHGYNSMITLSAAFSLEMSLRETPCLNIHQSVVTNMQRQTLRYCRTVTLITLPLT